MQKKQTTQKHCLWAKAHLQLQKLLLSNTAFCNLMQDIILQAHMYTIVHLNYPFLWAKAHLQLQKLRLSNTALCNLMQGIILKAQMYTIDHFKISLSISKLILFYEKANT